MAKASSSLTDKVTAIAAGAEVVACGFLSRMPAFALADGVILFADIGDERRVNAHTNGAVLIARCGAGRVVTGGDDGRVVETRADGSTHELANENGKWIDALALRDDGATAWAVAKTVRARDAKGEVKTMTAPSGVRGLDFMPKGYRVALAHYNGVSMWFPNAQAAPEVLEWKGSHHDVAFSPNGQFVVTAMQEPALQTVPLPQVEESRQPGSQ